MQNNKMCITEFDSCEYSSRLLDKLISMNDKRYNKHKINIFKVQKAIYYAKKYHGDQKRQSGEPYYSHPLEVAYMVCDYLFRTDIIITSILHDTLEDTDLTFEMIEEAFGGIIANQVMDLTRIKKDNGDKISSAEMIQSLFKQKKYDVLLVKQFDRLHNMQTIGVKTPEKMKKIIKETVEEFLIVAIFLKIPKVEQELIKSSYQALLIPPPSHYDRYLSLTAFQDSFQPLSPVF